MEVEVEEQVACRELISARQPFHVQPINGSMRQSAHQWSVMKSTTHALSALNSRQRQKNKTPQVQCFCPWTGAQSTKPTGGTILVTRKFYWPPKMTEWVIYWHLYQYQYLTPNHSKYLFSYLKTDADPKKKKNPFSKSVFTTNSCVSVTWVFHRSSVSG